MKSRRTFRTLFTAALLCAVCTLPCMARRVKDPDPRFHVTPLRPIPELLADALNSKPPEEGAGLVSAQLVDPKLIDPDLNCEIRYDDSENILGVRIYTRLRMQLEISTANALADANRKLRAKGYQAVVLDTYRPWYVTKMIWEATPPELHQYFDDPVVGSPHNRGCAVDVGLYTYKASGKGKPAEMPSAYDEMSPRRLPEYAGASSKESANRALLRATMESAGFIQSPGAWWSYEYKDCARYRLLNLPLESTESKPPSLLRPGVVAPKVLHRQEPSIPYEAKEARRGGVVTLELAIDEAGRITTINVLGPRLGFGLEEAAVKAVRQWTFLPATENGKPVAVNTIAQVTFQIY